ncbi:trypsin-like serine protease [Hyphobacterium sp. HN65]|uniref:Trypsin-like serine protease n=1 Tax=Hyphobacterium lacteum TaxID=3116575 RepID=A0ABU7LPZ9_9PROT|nr:trypsin-like serine protease [Hyphobacterium sp. HN65]MEE2525972.1 trypsin-like serine protease [Hyphobacterium sp. HN65]
MRILASLVAAIMMSWSGFAQEREERLSLDEIESWMRIIQVKPGMTGVPQGPQVPAEFRGDDSCRWANDNECDDPRYGTGACQINTDYSDCWRILSGAEDDSCRWANDNECDEPGLGTGACVQGTDATDCGDLVSLRFQRDSCETAFDGVCQEAGQGGDGSCAPRTDRSDCIGRERPLTIFDHYFGYDDRVFMDTSVFPWVVVGQITMDSGGACTATLIGPDVLVTAGHCIAGQNGVNFSGRFETGYDLRGGPRTARIIDYFMSPQWDYQRYRTTDDIDGTDWALLRIDTPLGDELGFVGIRALVTEEGEQAALRADIYQAGYSHDTGDHLSGNIACQMVTIYPDNTMAHECDTTRGDSGSPFMVREGNEYFIVATDSNFRRNPNGPYFYIAARADEWVPYYEDFVSGQLGQTRRPAGSDGVKPGGVITNPFAPAPVK